MSSPFRLLDALWSGAAVPRRVGFWCDRMDGVDKCGDYPDPHDCIDMGWDPAERSVVVAYLSAGNSMGPRLPPFHNVRWCQAFLGFSNCRVCGCRNGSMEFTDGAYVWPEGYAHYLEAHGVKPPEHFVRHVLDEVRKASVENLHG